MSIVDINVTVERPEFKRLTGDAVERKTVSMYSVKSYIIKNILMQMEVKDIKDLARFLDLEVGGAKPKIIKRIMLSGKIERIGLITS